MPVLYGGVDSDYSTLLVRTALQLAKRIYRNATEAGAGSSLYAASSCGYPSDVVCGYRGADTAALLVLFWVELVSPARLRIHNERT